MVGARRWSLQWLTTVVRRSSGQTPLGSGCCRCLWTQPALPEPLLFQWKLEMWVFWWNLSMSKFWLKEKAMQTKLGHPRLQRLPPDTALLHPSQAPAFQVLLLRGVGCAGTEGPRSVTPSEGAAHVCTDRWTDKDDVARPQPWAGMRPWHLLPHGWALNTLRWGQVARLEKTDVAWLCCHEVPGISNWRQKVEWCLPVSSGRKEWGVTS